MSNTVRPPRPDTGMFISTDQASAYITQLEAWCDHIESLHANQARYLMERNTTVSELRALNETQMTRINEVIRNRDAAQLAHQQAVSEVTVLTATVEALRSDLTIINEELDSEAVQREWCSEYKDFCDRVNERLTYGHLGPAVQTFHIEHTYEVTITGTVLARDQREAEDKADRQYGGIREGSIFRMPDDIEDALAGTDRGELGNVAWRHTRTRTTGNTEE